MNVRNRRNNLQKTLKDYLVPIVALILIVTLIYSVFSSDGNTSNNGNTNTLENSMGAVLQFDSDNTEAYIEFSGGNKKQVENNAVLYKGEKVIVKNGSIKIDFPSVALVALEKVGSLEYKEDGGLYLDSSNLWVQAKSDLQIDMKYGSAQISNGGVVNLNQNEVESSIYNISGVTNVSNLAGESTLLSSQQKVSIPVSIASSGDVDLATLKREIDDYFKASDWFIKNGGDLYLNKDEENTSTGEVLGTDLPMTSLLSFDNLSDESQASSNTIDITGKYNNTKIGKITLNGEPASLNEEEKIFKFSSFSLNDNINDLIFKIYDKDDNVIKKIIYTVYLSTTSSSASSNTDGFKVTTYELDASKFVFTSPSTTGTHTTYENRITLKGTVPAGIVSKVSVNDYFLSSFNGTSWRYHAWSDYNNLKDGTNVYQVKYFNDSGKMIYTNYFTIIKKSNTPTSTTKDTFSNEVSISS